MVDESPTNRTVSTDQSDQGAVQLTATAYHEAGHAVMALALGRLVQQVTVVAQKTQVGISRLGACEVKSGRSKASSTRLEDDVMILFAGMVAEARYTGEYCLHGAKGDLAAIKRILCGRATSQSQHDRLHRRLLGKTEHFLSRNGHPEAIELIARELISKSKISGRAVRHIYERTMQQNS